LASSPPQTQAPAGALLSISIVTYQPELETFSALLASLGAAVAAVRDQLGAAVEVSIVDHSPDPLAVRRASALQEAPPLTLVHDPANPGFGAGHNRIIAASTAPFHLILNPDVELPPEALVELLRYLQEHAEVAALGVEVRDGAGLVQSSCKGEVTVLDLALRGFAPHWLQERFAKRLARYECRDLLAQRRIAPALHLSGCFMLCRTTALQAVGGFDDDYFLYFEDFALSRALQAQGKVLYYPAVHIVHHGGGASRKGLAHMRYFGASAWRWFTTQGWRLW
jgi:GT2 family glycosyltransferase